jgi:hypothetical protein
VRVLLPTELDRVAVLVTAAGAMPKSRAYRGVMRMVAT